MADEQEFVVTLPINGVQADMAGMPAEWLERAVRAVGRPFDALASLPSAIVEEPMAVAADESIDHHAYRVAHIPEPPRSPQPHTGRTGVNAELVAHLRACANGTDLLQDGAYQTSARRTIRKALNDAADALNAALTVEPEGGIDEQALAVAAGRVPSEMPIGISGARGMARNIITTYLAERAKVAP